MYRLRILSLLTLALFLAFAACEKKKGNDNSLLVMLFGGALTAGDKATYTADGISFNMVYVPGGTSFPTGVNDEGLASVTNSYWIGETEVTFELWSKVWLWAITDAGEGRRADGGDLYHFNSGGAMGDGVDDTLLHPVTLVSWRDSMVFCNALTEWLNALTGIDHECVYTYDDGSGPEIIRDSRDTNATACDNAASGDTATGFRLPANNEWELASRYRDGIQWTYGDHASGDDSGACYDDGILGGMSMSTVIGDYAVYTDNSESSAAAVKSKISNGLGLYDMSGNVREWCFDLSGSERILRNGGWPDVPYFLQVGLYDTWSPSSRSFYIGFRIARSFD